MAGDLRRSLDPSPGGAVGVFVAVAESMQWVRMIRIINLVLSGFYSSFKISVDRWKASHFTSVILSGAPTEAFLKTRRWARSRRIPRMPEAYMQPQGVLTKNSLRENAPGRLQWTKLGM